MTPSARMGIGLVGDLPAGVVVAQALAGVGHAVIGRLAPSEDRADHVEALLPGVPVLEIADVARRAEMVIFAADGEARDHILHQWVTQELSPPGQIVAQVSQDGDVSCLNALRDTGVITLGLVPLLPLTGHSLDVRRLQGAWCGVVAPAPIAPIGHALAMEMGMEVLEVPAEKAPALASAIDRAARGVESFIGEALDPLGAAGIDNAPLALQALLHSSIDKHVRDVAGDRDQGWSATDAEIDQLLSDGRHD